MKKYLIFFIITLFNFYIAFAQPDFSNPLLKNDCCPEAKERLDSVMNNAPYVFEGRMVETDYLDKISENGDDYRSFLFEIDKVYKGGERLKGGTVEVITKERCLSCGRTGFAKSSWYILLCKESAFDGSKKNASNKIKLELFYDIPVFTSRFKGGIPHKVKKDGTFKKWNPYYSGPGLKFRSKRSVRKFFYKYGMKPKKPFPKPQIKTYQKTTTKPSKREIRKKRKEFLKMLKEQKHVLDSISNKNIRKKGLQLKSVTSNNSITFGISNVKNTGTSSSPRYLEFDITVNSDNNNSYMYMAVVELEYESNILGHPFHQNIVGRTPQKIWITRGTNFSNTQAYDLFTVASSDNKELTLYVQTSDPATGLTNLTSNPQTLAHVKMLINDNSPDEVTALAFISGTLSYYCNSSSGTIDDVIGYNPVIFPSINPVEVPLAPKPAITSFYINSIGNSNGEAGVGDVLTINGNYFGDQLPVPNSTVSFKLADFKKNIKTDDLPFYKISDSGDILSWSDSEIKVRLPSIANEKDETEPVIDYNQYPGTGTFKVHNAWGKEIESTSNISINYVLDNYYSGIPIVKSQTAIPRYNCVDGYRFRVSNDVKNDIIALATIQKALLDWSNELGIALELETDALGNILTHAGGWSEDGVNTIFYTCTKNDGSSPLSAMGTANHNYDFCGSGAYYHPEFDIGICNSIIWEKDYNSSVGSSEFDFYTAFLHELGHVVGLEHSANTNDLMWANIWPGERTTLISGSNNAKNAGNAYIHYSENIASSYWSGCTNFERLNDPVTICSAFPSIPSNFSASPGSSTEIVLSWDLVPDADSYVIEYSTQSGSGFQFLSNPSSTTSTFLHSGLSASTTYYYRIKSWNVNGDSPWSQEISASTTPTGIYDEVEITYGPTQFKTGEAISYQAGFTSNNGNTYPVTWYWDIVLNHSAGTYTLASSSTGIGLWGVTTNITLPSYNWTLDQNGNISGNLNLTVYVNDGSYVSDNLTLSVEECMQLYLLNETYTSNTTKQACYVTMENVTVQNGSKLTINSEMGTTITKDFNVTLGSTLEIE